jgi:hypothetical protein
MFPNIFMASLVFVGEGTGGDFRDCWGGGVGFGK